MRSVWGQSKWSRTASLWMSIVMTLSQSIPRCLHMTLADSGSPGLKRRSCLAYPKYGMTRVTERAPSLRTASCRRNISTRLSLGYVFCTMTTSSPRDSASILV